MTSGHYKLILQKLECQNFLVSKLALLVASLFADVHFFLNAHREKPRTLLPYQFLSYGTKVPQFLALTLKHIENPNTSPHFPCYCLVLHHCYFQPGFCSGLYSICFTHYLQGLFSQQVISMLCTTPCDGYAFYSEQRVI